MRVANLRDYDHSVEKFLSTESNGVYCGRPMALGNPFSFDRTPYADVHVADRNEAVEAYRLWLWACIQDVSKCRVQAHGAWITVEINTARRAAVRSALLEITDDSVLACWCHPKLCHCDMIARYVAWRDRYAHRPAAI